MNTIDNTVGKSEIKYEISKDTSVRDARWMLASVVFLAVAVFATGVVADMFVN